LSSTRPQTEPRPSDAVPRYNISDLKIDERKRRGSGKRWLKWLIVLALLGAAAVAGSRWYAESRIPVVEVAAAQPATNDPVTLLNASGYVTPRRRATVAAKITGRLETISVEEGMRVEAGQELAKLDDTDLRVRLASAEADRQATEAALADLKVNLANAERELDRAQRLHEAGVTSAQSQDTARTAVESLRARIASVAEQVKAAEARAQIARQDIENTVIRAPFAGMVVSKDAQRGEMVSPVSAGGGFTRTGIATIVDMSSLEIEVDVNESYIARVRSGQPVVAILDAYPDWKIPGKVRTIIPTADRQKATVKVRASFDRLDPKILPDLGVKVAFLGPPPSRTAASNTVVIPRTAVRTENGASRVFIHSGDHAESRPVQLGATREDEQEITSGLAAGDQVLINAPADLKDGQRVKLK
jgi:RND family efflux transporter MFP subunit